MPAPWGLILFLFYGDAVDFCGLLLAREIPTLGPLYWDSIFVFLLTFIPRLSLTMCPLHDSGKRGIWVKLPSLAVGSSVTLALTGFGALATSGLLNHDRPSLWG